MDTLCTDEESVQKSVPRMPSIIDESRKIPENQIVALIQRIFYVLILISEIIPDFLDWVHPPLLLNRESIAAVL